MSSPTVIRFATTEGQTAVVVTYFERHMGEVKLTAAFQLYDTGLRYDGTHMVTNSVWSTEQGAIEKFEEWRAAEIGDMPGAL